MSSILLFLHVATAVLFLGPVMVSTSIFGRYATSASTGDSRAAAAAALAHRITKTYGALSALVPLIGATLLFTEWSRYKAEWQFHSALILAVVAWATLLILIIPQQARVMEALGTHHPELRDEGDAIGDGEPESVDVAAVTRRLNMLGGIFNLFWVILLVLMYL